MYKQWIISFAIVLCLFPGSSSSFADGPSGSRPPKNWTVMVYINAKNNLEQSALRSFEDMASVGSSEDVDIVVALGRLPAHDKACQICNRYDWGGLGFYHVERGMNPEANNAKQYFEAGDMGSPETLIKFLKFARKEFPAKHYALIIWGHGYGFSFLTAMEDGRNNLKQSWLEPCTFGSDLVPDGCRTPSGSEGSLKAVSNDPETNHTLYNRQIAESIKEVLGDGSKLDILGFDACLMASVEIAYGMRDVADYLVASEDLVPSCSWAYREPLGTLVEGKGSLDAKRLARQFVEAYKDRFKDGPAYTTLSAVDLSRVGELAMAISALASLLTHAPDALVPGIQRARNGCRVFGRDDGYKNPVDLEEFLRNLQASKVSGLGVQQLISDVLAVLDSQGFILDRFAVEKGAFGLTIYFPATKSAYTDNADGYDNGAYQRSTCQNPIASHAVEFVCNYSWSLFLPAYYARLNP